VSAVRVCDAQCRLLQPVYCLLWEWQSKREAPWGLQSAGIGSPLQGLRLCNVSKLGHITESLQQDVRDATASVVCSPVHKILPPCRRAQGSEGQQMLRKPSRPLLCITKRWRWERWVGHAEIPQTFDRRPSRDGTSCVVWLLYWGYNIKMAVKALYRVSMRPGTPCIRASPVALWPRLCCFSPFLYFSLSLVLLGRLSPSAFSSCLSHFLILILLMFLSHCSSSPNDQTFAICRQHFVSALLSVSYHRTEHRRWLCYVTLRRSFWYIMTDVSEELSVSIIRAMAVFVSAAVTTWMSPSRAQADNRWICLALSSDTPGA
jgi:hypothetical protein